MSDRELAVAGMESDDIADCAVEYHEPTGSFRTEIDHQTRPVSEAIIWAVAHAVDQDPVDLPPLYDVIDPDSLNQLFCAPRGDGTPSGLSVSFQYAEQTVTAYDHGTIEITPTH